MYTDIYKGELVVIPRSFFSDFLGLLRGERRVIISGMRRFLPAIGIVLIVLRTFFAAGLYDDLLAILCGFE